MMAPEYEARGSVWTAAKEQLAGYMLTQRRVSRQENEVIYGVVIVGRYSRFYQLNPGQIELDYYPAPRTMISLRSGRTRGKSWTCYSPSRPLSRGRRRQPPARLLTAAAPVHRPVPASHSMRVLVLRPVLYPVPLPGLVPVPPLVARLEGFSLMHRTWIVREYPAGPDTQVLMDVQLRADAINQIRSHSYWNDCRMGDMVIKRRGCGGVLEWLRVSA